MGGVATCIDNSEAPSCLKVTEGSDDDKFVITRHGQFQTPINIMNIYGETESRSTKLEMKCEIVVIGDLNKQVGDIIKGNTIKESFGGKLIKDLIDTKKYILVNATSKVVGGPFTRFDPANPDRKSCIDLVMISKELFKHVHKLFIDKNLTFTPGRPISRNKIRYTDHRSLISGVQESSFEI